MLESWNISQNFALTKTKLNSVAKHFWANGPDGCCSDLKVHLTWEEFVIVTAFVFVFQLVFVIVIVIAFGLKYFAQIKSSHNES